MVLRFMLCHDPKYPQYYSKFPDPKYFIGAPTRDQVKRIYWDDLKRLIPQSFMSRPPNESQLVLYGRNGAELWCLGLDKPERAEGSPWDYGLIDEIGNTKPETWPNHIRPALSDRLGGCDFIGVPEGRNHYWELAERAREQYNELGDNSDWALWHWISADILPPEEIAAARADLDELVYKQEYEASFVNFSGLAYYNFQRETHVGRYRQYYNPKSPLVLCFDFNTAPGVCSVIQEFNDQLFDVPPGTTVSVAIGEIHIPRLSNTQRICKKIKEEWSNHDGYVLCYGDATGGAKKTSSVQGSDWDLIKQELYPAFGERLAFNVPKENPRERARINAVNSRLLTYAGDVRFLVDGGCKKTIQDFEGVRIIEGSAGEIDKDTDSTLSHITDAIGYYVAKEFPIQKYYTAQDIALMRDVLNRKAALEKEKIDRQKRARAA
jgi:hypothetical protein